MIAGLDISDLIATREKDKKLVLSEVKSIDEENERKQMRSALGQLVEYRVKDVDSNKEWQNFDKRMCMMLDSPPSKLPETFS